MTRWLLAQDAAEDLDDPLRMVEAGRQEPAADEMDLALAQLLEQAEQEQQLPTQ